MIQVTLVAQNQHGKRAHRDASGTTRVVGWLRALVPRCQRMRDGSGWSVLPDASESGQSGGEAGLVRHAVHHDSGIGLHQQLPRAGACL